MIGQAIKRKHTGPATPTLTRARLAPPRRSQQSLALSSSPKISLGPRRSKVLQLYEDPWFTFRFAEDRIISRFHLPGTTAGQRVSVFKIDPATGERQVLLATAIVADGGWVDLAKPIKVLGGEGFVAVPES